MRREKEIHKAEGKLGVLIPGIGGAVSTTFLAGVAAIRKGLALPIGSLTQMGTIRLGKRFEFRIPMIRDFVPLANLNDLVFGGWDVFPDDGYKGALQAAVLKKEDLEPVHTELQEIKPWPAVFKQEYVKNLHGPHVKKEKTHLELVDALRADIETFKTGKEGVTLCHGLVRQHRSFSPGRSGPLLPQRF